MKQPTTSQKKICGRKGIIEFVDKLNKSPLSVRFGWAVAFLLGKAAVYELQTQPKSTMADLKTHETKNIMGDENK